MSRAKCVWVLEVAVLTASGKQISHWDIWDSFVTREEANTEMKRALEKRPRWVTAKFHRATNRLRKYVPEAKKTAGRNSKREARKP
jgi:hypothetical protein